MPQPTAIIGMGCRFPGAPDLSAYWDLIRENRAAPLGQPDRWRGQSDNSGLPPAALLERIDLFDAAFFGISPHEADALDPQQRLLLELSWEAFEDAGVIPWSLAGTRTAVYFGAMWREYGRCRNQETPIDYYTAAGEDLSLLAGRVSHFLNLSGPSMVIQTASSSSLVAVHLACQSLEHGEATLALAGGVNLILSPESGVALQRLGTLAPDGRSKPFSPLADGYGRGEGGGVVVLKPLNRALEENDRIYGVILASAVNHDGKTRGVASPSMQAQVELLTQVYTTAGLTPEAAGYIEAHGSGTQVGDAAERAALSAVGASRIGSIKAQAGHLEAAAGIAGVLKAALLLFHGEVGPGIAGVSSFGLSGTNCHVILQNADWKQLAIRTGPFLFAISAKTLEGLRRRAAQLIAASKEWLESDLAALCYTSCVKRTHFAVRRALICNSLEHLLSLLGRVCETGSGPQSCYVDVSPLLLSAMKQFEAGLEPDWCAIFDYPLRCVSLPVYPWDRERFWHGEHQFSEATTPEQRFASVLGLPASFDPNASLLELGMDSLTALELEQETDKLGHPVPLTSLMEGLTFRELLGQFPDSTAQSEKWEVTRL